jgi:hypothetical protein
LLKQDDDYELLKYIIQHCKSVGNDNNAIKFDLLFVTTLNELMPAYVEVLPAFKKVKLVVREYFHV